MCSFLFVVSLAFSLVGLVSTADLVASCCYNLSDLLPSSVFFPNSANYTTSVESYWSQQEQALQPSCIIRTNTISEIATAIEYLRDANEDNGFGCPFAVRSGGHTPFAGSANIEAGITIDLSLVNEIEVSEDQITLRIGVGNRWGAVNHVLDPLGVATPGGRISGVEVGGFTTGGGVSFYSPRLGLVCDATLNFEMILASGETVNANSTSNPSLFRAIKGGSNNLGIVTHITLPLVPAGLIWGGFYAVSITYLPQVLSFFSSFDISSTYDLGE